MLGQGLNLLLYNVSFHLMIIGTKSIVSYYYSVDEFGFFSFSWNLAQASMMILQIVSFLLYPKILNRFISMDNDKILQLITNIREKYVNISFFFTYLAFACTFLIIKLFPEYKTSCSSFIILSLSLALYNFTFGSSTFLISKGNEKILSKYSFFCLMICIIMTLFISFVHFTYIYVSISMLISYCILSILINKKVYALLNIKNYYSHTIREIFSFKIWMPIILTLILVFSRMSYIYYFVPLLFFIIINRKLAYETIKTIKELINNPNFINI
jgi:O-antigen/teichoic acid export membrane protein